MRILSVSVVFPPSWQYGGPPVTAYAVAKEMMNQGHRVFAICTGNKRESAPVLDKETEWNAVPVIYCSRKPSPIPFYSPRLRSEVRARVGNYDIAIIRSSWTYIGPASSAECRRRGIPYIAYPEGTFHPWAWGWRRWKKSIFWNFFDKTYFQGAAAIVALTKSEAEDVRRVGLKNRVEIIPNGVSISDFEKGTTRAELEVRFPEIKTRPIVLFMGRIHPKKGLITLIAAFKRVHDFYSDALLVIAGPDEGRYKKEVKECVQTEGLNGNVLFTGPVSGEMKIGLLRNSDVFVLPSYSEGFPVAVLEALACKLPVVLTKDCHIPEVVEASAGIEVHTSRDEIAEAITTILADERARKQMGKNGYQLAMERFNWDRIAKMTIDLCSQIAS